MGNLVIGDQVDVGPVVVGNGVLNCKIAVSVLVYDAVGLARLFHESVGGFRVNPGRGVYKLVPVKKNIAGFTVGSYCTVGIPYNPVQIHKNQQVAQMVQLQVVDLPDASAEYIQTVIIVNGPGNGSFPLPGLVHCALYRVRIRIVDDHEISQVLEMTVIQRNSRYTVIFVGLLVIVDGCADPRVVFGPYNGIIRTVNAV